MFHDWYTGNVVAVVTTSETTWRCDGASGNMSSFRRVSLKPSTVCVKRKDVNNSDDDKLCDMEVQFVMKPQIETDRCICKRYGKLSDKRKQCPVCQEVSTPSEPTRKHKKCANTAVRALTHTAMNANAENVESNQIDHDNNAGPSPGHSYYQQYGDAYTIYLPGETERRRIVKPKLISATEFVGRYYFPEIIKYENLYPKSAIPTQLSKYFPPEIRASTDTNDVLVEASPEAVYYEHYLDEDNVTDEDKLTGALTRMNINNNKTLII